jgi:hypothetical protein
VTIHTKIEAADWSKTSKARAILDALRPEDLRVTRRLSFTGPDRFVLTGPVLERLNRLRSDHTAEVFGLSFADAEAAGLVHDYMALWRSQPEPEAALAERFGDPNRMGFRSDATDGQIFASDGAWTSEWRAQFPRKERAA